MRFLCERVNEREKDSYRAKLMKRQKLKFNSRHHAKSPESAGRVALDLRVWGLEANMDYRDEEKRQATKQEIIVLFFFRKETIIYSSFGCVPESMCWMEIKGIKLHWSSWSNFHQIFG